MTGGSGYEFEWDDAKAESDFVKHGVNFRDAMSVPLDPLALTPSDDQHSDDEERKGSLVQSADGNNYWSSIRSAPQSQVPRLYA